MNPNTRLAALLLGVPLAYGLAQDADAGSPPPSRAEVKADTRAAARAGELSPSGQGPEFRVPTTSNRTRDQRKTETLAARRNGTLAATGAAPDYKADKDLRAQKTSVDRAARKSQTRAEERSGSLIPAGEGPGSPRK